MSNTKPRAIVDCSYNVKDYTKDTPVKIAKGSLKGCMGKISGCTSDGVYFIWRDRSSQADCIHCPIGPIGPFLSNELELIN
ncbi:hypothetical protein IQ255_13895 [Pleurocapsales cyanobacterium LEGE 10410]|nr:hypothetical protein [Pleurocapsales cyanobacterium LEGE 10410]